ncbi:uncharacterized protein B0H18DRAFT_950721 [Fomitopsis serialis]|uniref:uncharacterized protein n=1 Tax=Fomitopsis serialis TaxID=139415 RepID=UPI002008AE99|nr:uncharacterized protein B0H18DRAFT_950721 [Neoantrodia serialis]KAH9936441.1 hypothetical protein B0H18DRAFT_950721 [Neoantrodia serialis]
MRHSLPTPVLRVPFAPSQPRPAERASTNGKPLPPYASVEGVSPGALLSAGGPEDSWENGRRRGAQAVHASFPKPPLRLGGAREQLGSRDVAGCTMAAKRPLEDRQFARGPVGLSLPLSRFIPRAQLAGGCKASARRRLPAFLRSTPEQEEDEDEDEDEEDKHGGLRAKGILHHGLAVPDTMDGTSDRNLFTDHIKPVLYTSVTSADDDSKRFYETCVLRSISPSCTPSLSGRVQPEGGKISNDTRDEDARWELVMVLS